MNKQKTSEKPGAALSSHTHQQLDEVIQLIHLMGNSQLAELEVETPGMKLTLKKRSSVAHSSPITSSVQPPVMTEYRPAAPVLQPSAVLPPAPEKPDVSCHEIVSPMAGTFYRAPSPTSPPFVQENDKITLGQTVCIIEAMKLMNEIKSDTAGDVIKILVENGKPVEKGTVLFHISKGN